MSNTVFTKYRSNCTNLKANKEVDYYETCGRKHSYSFMVNGRPRVRIVKLNDEPIGRQHAVAIRAYDSVNLFIRVQNGKKRRRLSTIIHTYI